MNSRLFYDLAEGFRWNWVTPDVIKKLECGNYQNEEKYDNVFSCFDKIRV